MTGVDGPTLFLRPNVLDGGLNHTVVLTSWTPGSFVAVTQFSFLSNKLPYGGSCLVEPFEGGWRHLAWRICCQVRGSEKIAAVHVLTIVVRSAWSNCIVTFFVQDLQTTRCLHWLVLIGWNGTRINRTSSTSIKSPNTESTGMNRTSLFRGRSENW